MPTKIVKSLPRPECTVPPLTNSTYTCFGTIENKIPRPPKAYAIYAAGNIQRVDPVTTQDTIAERFIIKMIARAETHVIDNKQ